jgi:mediator of RNA polymerase II transcription subunit 12
MTPPSAQVLEQGNWSRTAKQRVASGHQPFLQLILTCLRETEHGDKDKDKVSREERETEKEHLLFSLHGQLSTFLCFDVKEKLYDYTDPMARKTMQDALQLRFSLVGGMFESITTTMQSITDWSTLLVQLVVRGVIDLTNNSDLFCMVVDMLSILIHSTLIIDKEVGGSDRAEENKRSYLALVKKLKKEVNDRNTQSIRYIRQLLPIPKQYEEVIVTEQYGLIPDSKGAKVRGFNCDKKQGLQVAEKQKVTPWDILEGHKNPAPLSWHWFQAVKTERKPLKYEESFQNMKYMKNTMERPSSYYLSDPPLPDEDLQPTKDSKEEDKNAAKAKGEGAAGQGVGAPGAKPPMQQGPGGQPMGPGPMGRPMGPGMPGGPMGMQGQGGMAGPNNMAYSTMQGGQGPYMGPGGPMGPSGGMGGQPGPMGYSQPGQMGYSGGQGGPPGMAGAQGGPRFGVPQGVMQGGGAQGMQGGPSSNSKQALQNMLRARHPSPGGQFVSGGQSGGPQQVAMGGGPGQQYSGPTPQYGPGMGMGPTGQPGMAGMARPMYPGGQAMGPGYGGHATSSYSGGYGGNPGMRMSSPGPGMMRPSGPGQYGPGGMQGSMGMQGMQGGMGMQRTGMGPMSGGPAYGGMAGGARPQGYGMQGGMGPMSSSMGGPGMGGMRPQMQPMGPGGMAMGMQGSSGMTMQGQGGMGGMQSGGMGGMQSGGMGGMGPMQGQAGMGPGQGMQGGSQLMAHLQRGNSMGPGQGGLGPGQGGMGGYQQNRF